MKCIIPQVCHIYILVSTFELDIGKFELIAVVPNTIIQIFEVVLAVARWSMLM